MKGIETSLVFNISNSAVPKDLTNPRAQQFHLCSIVFLHLWSFHILHPVYTLGLWEPWIWSCAQKKNIKSQSFCFTFPSPWSLPCSLLLCTIVPPLPTLHLNHIPLFPNFMLLFPHFPLSLAEDQKKKKKSHAVGFVRNLWPSSPYHSLFLFHVTSKIKDRA